MNQCVLPLCQVNFVVARRFRKHLLLFEVYVSDQNDVHEGRTRGLPGDIIHDKAVVYDFCEVKRGLELSSVRMMSGETGFEVFLPVDRYQKFLLLSRLPR